MTQLNLFDKPETLAESQGDHLGVPGLLYHPGLLTPEEQQSILLRVDALPWQDDLKRKVQHYGYKYNYKARAVDPSMYVGPLPPFADEVILRLLDRGLI